VSEMCDALQKKNVMAFELLPFSVVQFMQKEHDHQENCV